MTVKALKKQLMAAIAMVVVSAIALSSSTYAWFAANNKVTADGMNVQAVAEEGLEIAAKIGNAVPADSSYATSAHAAYNATAALFPTSTVNTTAWAYATAAEAKAHTALTGSYVSLTLNEGNAEKKIYGTDTAQDTSQYYDANGKQYYLVNTFNIRTVKGSTKAKNVKVANVTVTTPNGYDKSLRVVVAADGVSPLFFRPADQSATSSSCNQVASVTDGAATLQSVTLQPCTPTAGSEIAFLSNVNTTGKDVRIYVYYEGEDTEHYTNNNESAGIQLAVTVDFLGEDVVTPG